METVPPLCVRLSPYLAEHFRAHVTQVLGPGRLSQTVEAAARRLTGYANYWAEAFELPLSTPGRMAYRIVLHGRLFHLPANCIAEVI